MIEFGMATNSASPSLEPSSEVHLAWERYGAEDGSGMPLLMVNGLGSPMVSYEVGLIEQFVARGFQVVRFDNRDTGRSSRMKAQAGEAPYLLVDMASDAVAVLDAVGWDRAHVWGQSMGGMIVQQLAISHSERLLSLTSLMSTTGNSAVGRPSAEAIAALTQIPPTDREGWLRVLVEAEELWCSPELWDPDRVRAKGELMFDYGVDPQGTARQYRAVLASGSRDDGLALTTTPTLVLHGSADNLIRPDGGRHTAEVIPGARYVEIDGLGHDLPSEMWPRLVEETAGFIQSL